MPALRTTTGLDILIEADSHKQAVIASREVINLLENASLFHGVASQILDSLLVNSKLVTLKSRETLLSRGVINENVYILISGRLSVQATPSLLDEPITMLVPGECVGEMSVLVDGMVSAYVIAITDCELISIDYASFWSLVDGSNEAARNMLNILVRRIRLGNEIVADSLLHHDRDANNDIIDNLTGLYNNHGMNKKFERLLQRCVVGNQPLCLIILELDVKEPVLDKEERLRNDQTMRTIAQTLLAFLRPDDHAARLTGKKFAILLANLSLSDATAAADRLKEAIKRAPVVLPDGTALPPMGISTGVSVALPDDMWNTLIARSDIVMEQSRSFVA